MPAVPWLLPSKHESHHSSSALQPTVPSPTAVAGELFSQEGEWPEGPQHPSPLLGPSSELGPVLGQLTGLTSLVVSDVVACQLYNQAPPRELAALTRCVHGQRRRPA